MEKFISDNMRRNEYKFDREHQDNVRRTYPINRYIEKIHELNPVDIYNKFVISPYIFDKYKILNIPQVKELLLEFANPIQYRTPYWENEGYESFTHYVIGMTADDIAFYIYDKYVCPDTEGWDSLYNSHKKIDKYELFKETGLILINDNDIDRIEFLTAAEIAGFTDIPRNLAHIRYQLKFLEKYGVDV